MAVKTIEELKNNFLAGQTATQEDFYDLIDTLFALSSNGSTPDPLVDWGLTTPKINSSVGTTIRSEFLNILANYTLAQNENNSIVITNAVQTLSNKILSKLILQETPTVEITRILSKPDPETTLNHRDSSLFTVGVAIDAAFNAFSKYFVKAITPISYPGVNATDNSYPPKFSPSVYIASKAGTYTNFGNIVLDGNDLFVFIIGTRNPINGNVSWRAIRVEIPTSISSGQLGGGNNTTITESIEMNGHKIENLGFPTTSSDAMTLGASEIFEAALVKLFKKEAIYKGRTIHEDNMVDTTHNTYIVAVDGTYKGIACVVGDILYFNGSDWSKLSLNKDIDDILVDTPTADINMNGQSIVNLGVPVNDTSAVTKGYYENVVISYIKSLDETLVYKGVAYVGDVPITTVEKDTYLQGEDGIVLGVNGSKGDILVYSGNAFDTLVPTQASPTEELPTAVVGTNAVKTSNDEIVHGVNFITGASSQRREYVCNKIISTSGDLYNTVPFILNHYATYDLDVTVVARDIDTNDWAFRRRVLVSSDSALTTPVVSTVGTDQNVIGDSLTLSFTTSVVEGIMYLIVTATFEDDADHFTSMLINGLEVISERNIT